MDVEEERFARGNCESDNWPPSRGKGESESGIGVVLRILGASCVYPGF